MPMLIAQLSPIAAKVYLALHLCRPHHQSSHRPRLPPDSGRRRQHVQTLLLRRPPRTPHPQAHYPPSRRFPHLRPLPDPPLPKRATRCAPSSQTRTPLRPLTHAQARPLPLHPSHRRTRYALCQPPPHFRNKNATGAADCGALHLSPSPPTKKPSSPTPAVMQLLAVRPHPR